MEICGYWLVHFLVIQKNPNTLTPQNYWETSNDTEAGATTVYNAFLWPEAFAPVFLVPSLYRGYNVGITRDVPSWYSLANFTLTDSNARLSDFWAHYYTGIYRATK